MKILIVDDSNRWVLHHKYIIEQIFNNNVEIDTANSAKEGIERLTASIDAPYDFISNRYANGTGLFTILCWRMVY